MQKITMLVATLMISCLFVLPVSGQTPASSNTGIAVVELFTSQGCSSCPPADDVLRQLDQRSDNGEPIFCLSFHVDYWNKLGWVDPYSKKLFSQRQRAYANGFDSNRVYTPQMIVNGEQEFVGSKKALSEKYVDEALAARADAIVDVSASVDSENKIATVRYELPGSVAGKFLNIAVVETSLSNKVPRGENARRTLSHANVVRAFDIVDLEDGATGERELELPAELKLESAEVIAYVQDRSTLKINGASRAPLTSPRE